MVPKNQIGKILDIVFIIGGFLLFITVGNLSADCLVVIQAVNSLLDTFLNGFFAEGFQKIINGIGCNSRLI